MSASLDLKGLDVVHKPVPPWFDELPVDWRSVPLRFATRLTSGSTPDKGNTDYWNGDIPWVSPKDMKRTVLADSEDHVTAAALDDTSLALIPTDSVLLVVRGMILAHSLPVAITSAPVTINQDMKSLRCGPALHPRFLLAVFQGGAGWLVSQAEESSHGTKRLDADVLGRFEIPCPGIQAQRRIANYLERETARLDALVAAKERLLGLLAEKRRALVTHAVTRGLDPHAPLRDSGIP